MYKECLGVKYDGRKLTLWVSQGEAVATIVVPHCDHATINQDMVDAMTDVYLLGGAPVAGRYEDGHWTYLMPPLGHARGVRSSTEVQAEMREMAARVINAELDDGFEVQSEPKPVRDYQGE